MTLLWTAGISLMVAMFIPIIAMNRKPVPNPHGKWRWVMRSFMLASAISAVMWALNVKDSIPI